MIIKIQNSLSVPCQLNNCVFWSFLRRQESTTGTSIDSCLRRNDNTQKLSWQSNQCLTVSVLKRLIVSHYFEFLYWFDSTCTNYIKPQIVLQIFHFLLQRKVWKGFQLVSISASMPVCWSADGWVAESLFISIERGYRPNKNLTLRTYHTHHNTNDARLILPTQDICRNLFGFKGLNFYRADMSQ